jgi:tRNA(fMet)-specific endonuclease VapC
LKIVSVLLDTNIVIGVLNGRAPHLRARLKREILSGAQIGVSTIVLFELRYGVAKSQRRNESEARLQEFFANAVTLVSFEQDDAIHAAEIRATLERAGTPIGYYDYLIAAQALRLGAILITLNTREFSRVRGLRATDWAA